MLEFATTNEEEVPVTIEPKTTGGHAARVDGPLRVRIDSGAATFTQDPTRPLEVVFVSSDQASTTTGTISADVDLGEGVELIELPFSYETTSAKASLLGATVGAARPKGVPVP